MLSLTKKQFIELMTLVEAMEVIHSEQEEQINDLFEEKGFNFLKSRCLEKSLIEFIAENVGDFNENEKGEILNWYLYECCDFKDEDKYIEVNGVKFPITNLEELYDFFDKN